VADWQNSTENGTLLTYDLVASLRESAKWIKDVEHESWFETADLQTEAADEIERLRYQMERLCVALDDISHLTTDRQVLHRVKEARRG
jgi:hypothetical protein